jgi:prefoldin subunit 5
MTSKIHDIVKKWSESNDSIDTMIEELEALFEKAETQTQIDFIKGMMSEFQKALDTFEKLK